MTYEDFCKRIEEELSTGDLIQFIVSNETLSSLLSQETKITVIDRSIRFGVESAKKLYELMAIHDSTVFDGTVHIMICDTPPRPHWYIAEYGAKYSFGRHSSSAVAMDTLLRTVTL